MSLAVVSLPVAELTAQTGWDPLRLDPDQYTAQSLTLSSGESIGYRAYEKILYVANLADPVYQTMNIYVPESAYTAPARAVFLKTRVGGYMAAQAGAISEQDATARALAEGYIVVLPGSRGSNSTIRLSDGSTRVTGTAPAGIVDLKAAVRYLRHNADRLPGDMERIITDGTSAGGALSALLGATGNHPDYEPYLWELGAADERDDVFAAVCFCPITDLEHADMAYEWFYHTTNGSARKLSAEQTAVSEKLAARYPEYFNSLGLRTPDGTPLTDKNLMDYIQSFLIRSAQRASDQGTEIPAHAGILLVADGSGKVTGIDLEIYLHYILSQRALKNPPAFDAMGIAGNSPTPENKVFGTPEGIPAHFTPFGLQEKTGNPQAGLDPDQQHRVYLMNPMNFIGRENNKTAPHWYIRHGAVDRDTAFPVPVNLATKLENNGFSVNFFLPWNRNHSGDYDLDELFDWINHTLENPNR
ncbi:MAG: alpha/beta hydrolase [Rikenellaceae bacterium]|nr:alpha/beta hydrolase [Rikenellaceae bacterium]